MGMIGSLFAMLFGSGRNVIKETAEIFRPNAEKEAQRDHTANAAVQAQFATEFGHKGWFNQLVDALNRLPRPIMAFGVIGLFVSAMVDPIWFAARMQGLVLVPNALWGLLGIIVTFYFGARYQAKAIDFQKDAALLLSQAQKVAENIRKLRTSATPNIANHDVVEGDRNPAVEEWQENQ